MFSNFAWSEILVIAAVAIIVVGPKDLPGMLRQLGKSIGGMKRMAGDFQRQFNDAIKEADLDEIKDMTSTKGFGPLEDARKSMEDFANSVKDPVTPDITPVDEIEAPAVEPAKPAAKSTAKSATKPAAKKTPVKKAPAKTATAKKSPARTQAKTATSKSAPAKKAPAKTVAAAKKPAAEKVVEGKSAT